MEGLRLDHKDNPELHRALKADMMHSYWSQIPQHSINVSSISRDEAAADLWTH